MKRLKKYITKFSNNRIESVLYEDTFGEKCGPYKKLHSNGVIKFIGYKSSDDWSGLWKRWNGSGNRFWITSYKKDRKNGINIGFRYEK